MEYVHIGGMCMVLCQGKRSSSLSMDKVLCYLQDGCIKVAKKHFACKNEFCTTAAVHDVLLEKGLFCYQQKMKDNLFSQGGLAE